MKSIIRFFAICVFSLLFFIPVYAQGDSDGKVSVVFKTRNHAFFNMRIRLVMFDGHCYTGIFGSGKLATVSFRVPEFGAHDREAMVLVEFRGNKGVFRQAAFWLTHYKYPVCFSVEDDGRMYMCSFADDGELFFKYEYRQACLIRNVKTRLAYFDIRDHMVYPWCWTRVHDDYRLGFVLGYNKKGFNMEPEVHVKVFTKEGFEEDKWLPLEDGVPTWKDSSINFINISYVRDKFFPGGEISVSSKNQREATSITTDKGRITIEGNKTDDVAFSVIRGGRIIGGTRRKAIADCEFFRIMKRLKNYLE